MSIELEDYELNGFHGKSLNTKDTYLTSLTKFEEWLAKVDRTLGDFTFVELQQYMNHLHHEGSKASTINKDFNAIKHYCRYVNKSQLYENVYVLKETKALGAPKSLKRTERNAMLREANKKGSRDYAIICLLLYTGLRVNECELLDIKNLFDIGEKTGFLRVIGKGFKERVVPVNNKVRQALMLYLQERNINFYDKEDMKKHEKEPLFTSNRGSRISKRRIQQIVRETGDTHAHALRHTFATMMVRENGFDPVAVAQLMGHSSLAMMQRYTQSTNEELQIMLDGID